MVMDKLQATPFSTKFEHPLPTVVSAYHQCRMAEAEITSQIAENPNNNELQRNRMCIRILGYLLSHGPTIAAVAEAAQAVVSCRGNQDRMINLGELYLKYYIRLFRKHKGPTPNPSLHPSRPSFDYAQQEILERLIANPRDHRAAKALALVRDDYRCMVTGAIDDRYFDSAPEWLREQAVSDGLITFPSNCCHIFPESTNMNLEDSNKANYAPGVWNILRRWGEGPLEAELAGDAIHSLTNILTLASHIHDDFDRLNIWFEETAIPNRYNIGAHDPTKTFRLHKIPRQVTLQSTNPALELPNPRLLRLHAACCKVAWLSGAAGYIEQLEKDKDNYDPCGPVPADTLAALLSEFVVHPFSLKQIEV